jgi:hypothetical protein
VQLGLGTVPVMPLASGSAQNIWNYWRDACQRAVLFWDVKRRQADTGETVYVDGRYHILG